MAVLWDFVDWLEARSSGYVHRPGTLDALHAAQ